MPLDQKGGIIQQIKTLSLENDVCYDLKGCKRKKKNVQRIITLNQLEDITLFFMPFTLIKSCHSRKSTINMIKESNGYKPTLAEKTNKIHNT
jgi:hypothetical protein